jgi:hypothetical protein
MKNKTVLMAAVFAISTVLAGLTVLPSAVQEAQANPCSVNGGSGQSASATLAAAQSLDGDNDEDELDMEIFDCEINGVISEDDD